MTSESLPSLPAASMNRQRELEDNSLTQGGERFRERLEKAIKREEEAGTGAAKKLLAEGLKPLTAAVQALIDGAKGKRGRRHVALHWCELLGAETAAYMTLKTVLDGISRRVTLRRAALDIMELILDELRFRRFRKEQPQIFEYRLTRFHTSNYAHMARSLHASLTYNEVDVSDLEPATNDRILVGMKLIDLLITSTGLVSTETVKEQGTGRKAATVHVYLVATSETEKWLEQRNAQLEFLWPVNLPMVVPPRPWEPGKRGGYWFALQAKHPMVRGVSKKHQETIQGSSMPDVYAALNRIQETPWKINQRVLSLLGDVSLRGITVATAPSVEAEEIPSKPLDIDTNEESAKRWRREAHAVHEREHERKQRVSEFQRVLRTAAIVKDEPAIWFPYNLDFRGRIYPVVNYLHPQGDDMVKALLTFAQGKPLGRDGVAYLALHGANCLGSTPEGVKLSKSTLQERVDYIVSITNRIEQVSQDPLADIWWADADDPWQFFAFCCEWAGWAAYEREGRGEQYVSSLPCAMDGSCNGLQHFSAMLRDEVGGAAVNVSPSDRPQDIYQRIADHVLERLERTAADDALARLWLTSGLVDRKLTKRPTMTFGYGSKKFGFRTQLVDYVKDLPRWKNGELRGLFSTEGDEKPGALLGAACGHMSGLIWNALGEVVVAAQQGMSWMQETARLIAQNGRCVEWRVPGTGFPVRQEYFVETEHRVKTVIAGSVVRPMAWTETTEPNVVKQANAVAPNVVHSLDAAALMLTVKQSSDAGIEHFGMVHDSYATLAADCPVLADITRRAFFSLYSQNDVVNLLAGQFLPQIAEDEEMPQVPSKGTLDISGVLLSDYFFA